MNKDNNRFLIAFDLDGTLLTDSMDILPETVSGIRQLVRAGHYCVVISARIVKSILTIVPDLPFSWIAGLNGAMLYNCVTGEETFSGVIDREKAEFVINKFSVQSNTIVHLFYHDAAVITRYDKPGSANRCYQESMSPLIFDGKVPEKPLLSMEIIIKDLKKYYSIVKEVQNNLPDCTVAASGHGYISINGLDVSKGSALRSIAADCAVTPRNTISVGDSHSDIPMLKSAAVSIAMSGAKTDVRQAADYVTQHSNNHNGAVEAVLDLLGVE